MNKYIKCCPESDFGLRKLVWRCSGCGCTLLRYKIYKLKSILNWDDGKTLGKWFAFRNSAANVIIYAIFRITWEDNFIGCPSQCYGSYKNKNIGIYLRWRHNDPWGCRTYDFSISRIVDEIKIVPIKENQIFRLKIITCFMFRR